MERREPTIQDFYENKIKLRGNSEAAKIDYIHQNWADDYKKLEKYHGYIQWIFPNKQRSRFNSKAPVITDKECIIFKKSSEIGARIVKSSIMMLDFWGFEIDPEEIEGGIVLRRCTNWKSRLRNLRGHNFLRVTRMIKFWGLVGMESWQYPFILRCMFEMFIMGELKTAVSSCQKFWIGSVKGNYEKAALMSHFSFLVEAVKNVEEFTKLATGSIFETFRRNTPEFEIVYSRRLKSISGRRVSKRQHGMKAGKDSRKKSVKVSSVNVRLKNKSAKSVRLSSVEERTKDENIVAQFKHLNIQ